MNDNRLLGSFVDPEYFLDNLRRFTWATTTVLPGFGNADLAFTSIFGYRHVEKVIGEKQRSDCGMKNTS